MDLKLAKNKLPPKEDIVHNQIVELTRTLGVATPVFRTILDEAEQFAPQNGEELHRKLTIKEADCRLMLIGLVDWIEGLSVVDVADQWMMQYFAPYIKQLSDMSYSLCMETMMRKKKMPIYCGIRRHQETLWWVFRQPSPQEEIEDAMSDLLRQAGGGCGADCTCGGPKDKKTLH